MPAGTYILTWTGTATGRVYNTGATPPSYAASPVTVTLDGTANVEVEFTASGGTATLQNVQLEAGSVASAFERRPIGTELALCQRYYYQTDSVPDIFGISFSATIGVFYQIFPVTMRITPTPVYPSTGLTNAVDEFGVGSRTPTALAAAGANTNSDNFQCTGMSGITAGRPLRYVGPALAYGAEL